MLNEFQNPDYTEGEGPWDSLAAKQQSDRENEQIAANQQLFDGFSAIEDQDRQQRMLADQKRAIAGAAMMQSAFRNGGLSDRSLAQSLSAEFGMPIYGGQIVKTKDGKGSAFVMYGQGKDPNTGAASVAPVAMMDDVQMMQVLQKARLGDRTSDLQRALYSGLSSRLTKYQLGSVGIQNPDAATVAGSANISGSTLRSLRGEPRQRSTISVFSNIGADGKAGTGTRSATIRPDGSSEEVTTGNRRADYQGSWKVTESGAEGRRYANDKTGEELFVPQGDSLRNVLQRGGSEKERIAQMNNESREKRAQIAADATREKANRMKEVAEIRAKASGKKDGFKVGDLKILNDIANDMMADEESRNAAKGLMGAAIDQLSGKASQPAKAVKAETAAPQGGETIEEKKARLEAMKKALEEKRKARASDGSSATGGRVYMSKSGDDLASVAIGNTVSPSELKELNPDIKNWDSIAPGTRIRLPEDR